MNDLSGAVYSGRPAPRPLRSQPVVVLRLGYQGAGPRPQFLDLQGHPGLGRGDDQGARVH